VLHGRRRPVRNSRAYGRAERREGGDGKRGKTSVLTEEQACRLLASIKVRKTITSEDGTEKEVPLLARVEGRHGSGERRVFMRPIETCAGQQPHRAAIEAHACGSRRI
jgi:hypothetical protein